MPITRAARANRANRTLLLNKIKFAFGSVVSEFLFPICVQKASSMKILLFCVINSSRHRKCFVRGFIHSLFVSKALTRSYLARSGFDTNNSWIKPRTPHFLWRKLYLGDFWLSQYRTNSLLISARPQRQTNANECRILGDLDQLESKDTVQKR